MYDVAVTVTDGYYEGAMAVASPCDSFTVGVTAPAPYTVQIAGQPSPQSFPTASTASFTYTIADPAFAMVVLATTVAVTPSLCECIDDT